MTLAVEKPQRRPMQVALAALVIALVLWLPASVANGCPDPGYCDDFEQFQVLARSVVAFSPMWLLVMAAFATRFRSVLALFAIASIAMAVVTLVLATDLRLALRPLGLSSASGFVLYAAPFAIAGGAAVMALRRPRPSPRHQAVM